MVGRFRREKRWDVILAAAKLLPEWHFTLVGDGPLKGSYMKKARKQNLRNVEFAGQLSHSAMLKTLLQSSVSVLLSRSEGMPNVALEALALGVLFIGSDIAAHRELLADGRGTLVHDTPEALVGALQVLSSTPPKILEKRRMQTQQYIRARYSLKALTEQTQAVWSTLLQKRPA